jgi:hypothetical protein
MPFAVIRSIAVCMEKPNPSLFARIRIPTEPVTLRPLSLAMRLPDVSSMQTV